MIERLSVAFNHITGNFVGHYYMAGFSACVFSISQHDWNPDRFAKLMAEYGWDKDEGSPFGSLRYRRTCTMNLSKHVFSEPATPSVLKELPTPTKEGE